MTNSPAATVRGYLYRVFYRVPPRWRRRLVRLGSAKYTVGAVILVRAEDDAGQLVLLRQPPGRSWSLPAGLLKRNEPAAVGAARELYEETGLRVPVDRLTPADPTAVVHTHGRWVDVVFEARVPAGSALHADGAEVLEARWYPLAELPRLTPATANLLGHYGIGPGAPAAADPAAPGAAPPSGAATVDAG